MRWTVFIVAALLALVLDLSLMEVIAPDAGRQVRPSLCAVLAVFIALSAPRTAALWACLLLGLLQDLSYPVQLAGGDVFYLPGPYALGYLLGAWLIIHSRTMLFRRRPLTIGAVTAAGLLVINLVVVGLYAVRAGAWYPGASIQWTDGGPWRDLGRRGLVALYSGALGIPAGWLLVKLIPLWNFRTIHRPATLRKD